MLDPLPRPNQHRRNEPRCQNVSSSGVHRLIFVAHEWEANGVEGTRRPLPADCPICFEEITDEKAKTIVLLPDVTTIQRKGRWSNLDEWMRILICEGS